MKLKKLIISSFCLVYILILSSCSSNVFNSIMNEVNSDAYKYNQKGLELMEKGEVNEAIEYFNKSLNNLKGIDVALKEFDTTHIKSEDLFDSPLNNLSWAHNELGEHEKSLEYIELSLKILPNTDAEYVNKGNALYGLSRYEEALENYNKALEENSDNQYAYFGKGTVYFENRKYQEALTEFDKYLEYENYDFDVVNYKIYCHLYLGEKDIALEYTNDVINNNKDDYKAYEAKATVLEWTGSYEVVKNFYEETAEKFPGNLDAQIDLGGFYYNEGKYNKSLDHFIKLIKGHPDNIDLYTWVIYNYSALEEYDKALEYSDKALKLDDESHVLYSAIGNIYIDKTSYMESIKYFDKAIELSPYNEDAYLNKLYALFTGKRYTKCIEFGKEAEVIFSSLPNIPWFIGESYLELDMLQEAIEEYKKSIELKPENDEVLSNIAYAYLLLEDYQNAEEYVHKSLEVNSENSTALYVEESLLEKQNAIGEQIKEFFYDNYLYNDKSPDLEKKLSAYLNKENISNEEISEVIERVKRPDDIFTFVIYGEDYDYLMENEYNDVEYNNFSEEICYLRINNFSINTDNRAIEILDNIEETENKTLVIDLRGNLGGHTESANNILDALLPERVTSSLIYKDGYNYNYYSDASQISFKKIYIFVDENSASASELLALGLKTYLNDVTIIGRKTFGKGVGQHVYEDKERKIMVFVVSHYWNVRQTNIMDTRITPDIYVKGNDLKEFFNAINIDK